MGLKVTVITVCYNADKFIDRAINSVLNQSYNNIEYIIIDGKSNDETVSIINKCLDEISYFISEPDDGIYDAMNKGIKASTGDIIFFLNSDDYFYDTTVVEKIVNEFLKYPNIKIIYGDLIRNEKSKQYCVSGSNVTKDFLYHYSIGHQAIFSRKDVFEITGLFNTSYQICADYDWLLNAIIKNKIEILYTREIISIFYVNQFKGNELELRMKNYRKERNEIRAKYFNVIEKVLYGKILFMLGILINRMRSRFFKIVSFND